MKYVFFTAILSITVFSGCGGGGSTFSALPGKITLPTTYSANNGRVLASSCFGCHGTNGVSTNSWDSLSAGEMDEMIGEHPLMDAIGVGYTQSEISAMRSWLSTMSNSGDNEEGDENENDGDKNKDEGDDD